MSTPIILSWSGGKDCLMALGRLRADPGWNVLGLLTTVTANYDRIAMHGIRRTVLHAQAAALGLPVIEASLTWPSDNESYEQIYRAALNEARARWPGISHCAFGDLFLDDVRAYRETQLARDHWQGVFPLWGEDTSALARRFVAEGHRAALCCVDTTQLDAAFCGRDFDHALLDELPNGVDACGERGEFHTLSYGGPLFAHDVALERGDSLLRDERFQYTDFLLAYA
ncbi:uncharacterized protein (TIGR00290 family) [Luteibacter rhizovicinus]|uniref:Uncharacterized protein (TIGR00290 family) n=1 Tax=Luteibacter rhizovicinus TaxID=242606 RepID=A0A4R3YTW5_9GAMM|nr:ATP-binding protein [Luteibacter rhizovicinus]TCV94593.1 uncharacterized protein (TIGR00290 family) [Luteibacter rhizovicinus]